ncbi:uncharacterized protein LOC119345352 [Triticum dicoccoides]|uniref:uncharacterized protein LOC119345352 n=1 Tax=Triticum dicoccoides TaxID=85692 RepID=UPI00188DDFF2|nr:uncharacterized protein LOC119345352 [Triticum dicoccoides]
MMETTLCVSNPVFHLTTRLQGILHGVLLQNNVNYIWLEKIIPTGLNHDPKLPEDHPRMAKCRTHENDSSIRGLFLAKYYFYFYFFLLFSIENTYILIYPFFG